ncbi:MAG TPA: carboxypeptidase-like regulatory domain-containing protein [Chitinophagaceae bacterium]|nr:carboxypeptidase-like regulatory domain-containing protein [Chitinophagaceae bacterium]
MRKLMYLLTLLLMAKFAIAQQKQVSGIVTSKASGAPLQGVTVQAGNAVTITDAAGKFVVNVSVGETVVLTYAGLKAYSFTVRSDNAELKIQMEDDVQNLEEVVVTGYTKEKKKD